MGFRRQTDDRRSSASEQPLADERVRMSGWRWLLFRAMSRFETAEDKYFRIPNAKTIRRDIRLDEFEPKSPHSADTSGTAIE